MNKFKSLPLQILVLFSLLWLGAPNVAADDPTDIIRNGKFYADLRYRFEGVGQDGIDQAATASTFRSRFGLITGEYKNFQASIEMDSVGTIGSSRFNNTINDKSQFPAVADPRTNELNALWISWKGLPDTSFKIGRQPINLDNQRFIGTVGFRQNDQTYDAAVITNSSIKNLNLFYSFTDKVNRVFGHKHPAGKLDTTIHLGRAEYEFLPNQKAIAYTYWLEFDPIANATTQVLPSTKTYGLRIIGGVPLTDDFSLPYLLEGARQHDYGNNQNDFTVSYYHVATGVSWKTFTIKAGIESLDGNGRDAFSTPLSTLHAQNGWADKFLVTPVDGLQDRYLSATYRVAGLGKLLDDTYIQLIYHDFNAVKGNANYGTEWNADITKVFTSKDMMLPYMKQWSIGLRYADYNAKDLFNVTDTRKGWFTLAAKF